MKVKIGDQWFDPETQPVMVVLTDQDKEAIKNMAPEDHRYCQFPPDLDAEAVERWMKT